MLKHDEWSEYYNLQRKRFPQHACDLPPTQDRVFSGDKRSKLKLYLRYRIQKILVAWRAARGLQFMRPSNYSIEMEQARHARSKYWYLIHPMSRLFLYWQMVIITTTSMYLLIYPFRIAFLLERRYLQADNSTGELPYIWWLDPNDTDAQVFNRKKEIMTKLGDIVLNILNGIFFMHILVKAFTGYPQIQLNRIVMKQSMIIKRYAITWFVPDILTVIPTTIDKNPYYYHRSDDVNLWEKNRRRYLYISTILECTYLFRSHYIIEYVMNWGNFFGVCPITVFAILFFMFSIFHTQWCAFLMVRISFLVNGPMLFKAHNPSWISNEENQYASYKRENVLSVHYFGALHRVFRAAGTFSPYFRPKMANEDAIVMLIVMWKSFFFSIVFCLGIYFYATLHYSNPRKRKELFKQVKLLCRVDKYPTDLRRRVLSYYNFRYDKRYYNIQTIYSSMPPNIKLGMKILTTRRVLAKSTLFRGMPGSYVDKISAVLQEAVYLPHDVVYASRSEATYLYFLSIGTVAVYTPTGEEVGHLHDNDFFGEIGLVLEDQEERQIDTVVALELCVVFKLNIEDFMKFIRPVPQLYKRIYSLAKNRAKMVVAGEHEDITEWVLGVDEEVSLTDSSSILDDWVDPEEPDLQPQRKNTSAFIEM